MVSYKYDSYGNIKQISVDISLGNLNPFRYKGYYYDNESGMYYCKSRYYVAYWRRWLNMDRIEYLDNTNIGNINLFSYCNNNPVMMIDDKGNFALLGLIISVGLSMVFEVIEDALDGNGMDHDWKDYLGAGISGALGAMGGTKLMKRTFTLVGGMTDAVLSGDLEKNGLGSTLLSIGISSLASWGLGRLGKKLNSNVKANSLKKLKKVLLIKSLPQWELIQKLVPRQQKMGYLKL